MLAHGDDRVIPDGNQNAWRRFSCGARLHRGDAPAKAQVKSSCLRNTIEGFAHALHRAQDTWETLRIQEIYRHTDTLQLGRGFCRSGDAGPHYQVRMERQDSLDRGL